MKVDSSKNISNSKYSGVSPDSSDELSLSLDGFTPFLKKHYVVILLLFFMIFGFYLRSYHMDFPVIGYHNMKENQYIPYTEFMYNAGEALDYFRTETYWLGLQEHGYFTQYEFPLIPWIILVLWWIFGVELWAARLVVILFSIGCIPLLYLLGRKLTENKFILLASSLFFTIMPLSIFFGRNVQPEAPGLFFILLGSYWFFSWREGVLNGKHNRKHFLYFSLSMLVAILLKIPNGIGLIPLLFFVPYRRLLLHRQEWKHLKYYILVFLGTMAFFPFWVKFSQWVMPGAATVGTSGFGESFNAVWHNILRTFTSSYWIEYYPAFKSFFLDNFTLWFFWLLCLGLIFAFIKRNKSLGLFIISSFFSVFVYVLAFADKVRAHAYYQYVFLPLVCLASAYALYIVADILYSFVCQTFSLVDKQKKSFVKMFLPLLLLSLFLFFAWAPLEDARNRVFDTIFYGEDVAGEFILQNSDPTDRVFIDGVFSQSVGILTHAKRYGTEEITPDLVTFQDLEESLNFRWVVLYSYGLHTIQTKPDVWEYIQNTYKIRHIGLIIQNGQYTPYYVVMEKSDDPELMEGGFDLVAFTQGKEPYLATTYITTQGEVEFYAIDDTH